MAHEIKLPKNQPQFSQMMMGQHWLDKIKATQAFKLTRNSFKKLQRNFKKLFN